MYMYSSSNFSESEARKKGIGSRFHLCNDIAIVL
jgi:hypothetical protein